MSVERTGSVFEIHSASNTGSQSVTVPADATLMVVGVVAATSETITNFLDGASLSLDGASLSNGRMDDNDYNYILTGVFYKASPATGNKTFAWNFGGTANSPVGNHIFIAFYKGVDTSNPIRSAGGEQDDDANATTGSLTAASGDALFGVAGAFRSPTNATNITWSNAIELDDDEYNGIRGACAEAFPAGNVTVTATQSGGSGTEYATSISAIVMQPVSVSLPTVTTQAASNVDSDSATGNGTITATGGENCDKRGFVYGTSRPGFDPDDFLVFQEFEGTGYDHDESWLEWAGGTLTTGIINPDYTTNPLAGDQSLRMVADAAYGTATIRKFADNAGLNELYGYFKFKLVDLPSGTSEVQTHYNVQGAVNDPTDIDYHEVISITNYGSEYQWCVQNIESGYSQQTFSVGTLYHVWWHIAHDADKKSSGWIKVSTIETMPESNALEWSNKSVYDYANSRDMVYRGTNTIAFTTQHGNSYEYIVDDCLVKSTAIGSISSSNPGNVAPGSSGYDSYAEDSGSYGTGAFTKDISGLDADTIYYMRAYAHNSQGYAYGDEVSFQTASGSATYTSGTSLNALIQKGFMKTAALDALIRRTALSRSASLDSYIAKGYAASTGADAFIQTLKTIVASLDAMVQTQGTPRTASLDALVEKAGFTAGLSVDALVAKITTASLSTDAYVQKSFAISTALNALIAKGHTASLSLDAMIQIADAVKSLALDAVIRALKMQSVSLDAIVLTEGSGIAGVSLDALIQALKTRAISLDAILSIPGTETISLDAYIQALKTGSVSLDAIVHAVSHCSLAVGIDAMVQAGHSASSSLDAIIQGGTAIMTSLDGCIAALRSGDLSLDALVALRSASVIGMDALMLVQKASTTCLDAYLLYLGETITPRQTVTAPGGQHQ